MITGLSKEALREVEEGLGVKLLGINDEDLYYTEDRKPFAIYLTSTIGQDIVQYFEDNWGGMEGLVKEDTEKCIKTVDAIGHKWYNPESLVAHARKHLSLSLENERENGNFLDTSLEEYAESCYGVSDINDPQEIYGQEVLFLGHTHTREGATAEELQQQWEEIYLNSEDIGLDEKLFLETFAGIITNGNPHHVISDSYHEQDVFTENFTILRKDESGASFEEFVDNDGVGEGIPREIKGELLGEYSYCDLEKYLKTIDYAEGNYTISSPDGDSITYSTHDADSSEELLFVLDAHSSFSAKKDLLFLAISEVKDKYTLDEENKECEVMVSMRLTEEEYQAWEHDNTPSEMNTRLKEEAEKLGYEGYSFHKSTFSGEEDVPLFDMHSTIAEVFNHVDKENKERVQDAIAVIKGKKSKNKGKKSHNDGVRP